jgi:glycosyltransferase involved in cell wall biosynthesis
MKPKIGSDIIINDVNASNCKVSVIIPVFNTEKYLRRCLDSVLSQTFTDFELILVDDFSADDSPEICEEYAKNDRRIKVIHNRQNKGSSLARKAGLDVACGDYILFVDSDDWIENNMLELIYNKALSDGFDIVYCGIYQNTNTGQNEYRIPFLDNKIEIMKQILTWNKFTPSLCNKLIKHKIYNMVNFPVANFGEDRQIIVQAIHYASRISFIKESLYHYNYNNNSLCNDSSGILKRYIDEYEITKWIIKFLENNYIACFYTFEPELSAYINSLKLHFVQEKPIRDIPKLHELYPNSNSKIFDPSWKEALYNKIILFFAVNNIVCIAYTLSSFFNILKKIYRFIIPENIRSMIWEKRNTP